MVKETFVAKTPEEAFTDAVNKYGSLDNVEIVSARHIRDDEGKLRAEITIEVPKALFMEKSFSSVAPAVSKRSEDEGEEALIEEIEQMKEELSQMREEMLPELEPPVVKKVKTLFLQKGISQKWLDEKCETVLTTPLASDEKLLVSYLLEEIDDAVRVRQERLDVPKMMMLVGPTGVGKTTTIAKLAARYAYLLDQPYKVALVNLDSYKVGAVEQLAHYAEIMQIEHHSVATPEAFREKIEALNDFDIILVDTAGMSPYDTKKFIKVIEFVQSDTPRALEVHLTLSATVKYEDMDDIYQNFSFLNPDALIISKFDETRHLGSLINFMLRYDLPASYFSVGQEVPDDLLVANKEYLLERFIGDVREG
jgi:flagellar biosynthesis protein FlhF